MKNKFSVVLLTFFFLFAPMLAIAQKQFNLKAPQGKLEVTVMVGDDIKYVISHDGDVMVNESSVSMTLLDGESFGVRSKLSGTSKRSVNDIILASVYKKSEVKDYFNEMTVKFKNFDLIFRAYDEGIAYRFVSKLSTDFKVKSEEATFNFAADPKAYVAYTYEGAKTREAQFETSFENTYTYQKLSEWDQSRLAFSPLVVEAVNGKKVALMEADLLDYPGMYLFNEGGGNSLKGIFAPVPREVKQGGHNMLQLRVQSREEYIANCAGKTAFPWRIVSVSVEDKELANNDMVYKLASPSQGDFSWVKPGKVAWDWWNTWNLYGVDFEAGINNETYKYYIDFAAKYGIEYVILDEGWAVNLKADLMQVVPEIDLQQLVSYGKSKNVDIILWAGYHAFDRDMEQVCKHYSDMGVKGFKVDFMDRDDQFVVNFHHRAAQMAAKYKMLLDFHGTYKPTGLQRTYPNVINFEGVYGLEQMKWGGLDRDQVEYDVTIPFTRQLAGPLDYTQGAMRNASNGNFRSVSSEGMSAGTRCRQLAEYVIFESPLNMLCDSPSNYMNEDECTEFIAKVPTTWDETVSINGEIAKYITIARRKAGKWYIGSMTNWDARKLTLDLSFLGDGEFKAVVYKDGVNAHRVARDYVKQEITIPANKQLPISMAPGGGYVMEIVKK